MYFLSELLPAAESFRQPVHVFIHTALQSGMRSEKTILIVLFVRLFAEKLSLDDLSGLGSLLVHLLREAEVGDAGDGVAAHLGGVGPELPVGEIHLAQGLEDAREVHFALAHGGVLVDGHIRAAAGVEPRRVEDVAAVFGLVVGVGEEDVGQLVAGVFEHRFKAKKDMDVFVRFLTREFSSLSRQDLPLRQHLDQIQVTKMDLDHFSCNCASKSIE